VSSDEWEMKNARENEKCTNVLVGKTQRKKPHRRPRCRREYNIKINLG
jgi:hypothetical protein